MLKDCNQPSDIEDLGSQVSSCICNCISDNYKEEWHKVHFIQFPEHPFFTLHSTPSNSDNKNSIYLEV